MVLLHYRVGDDLPRKAFPAISRTQLALFAGGSSDHNPMHIDSDFARSAGMADVFAHGMLVMALLGKAVTEWVSREALEEFSARFVNLTEVGDELVCSGQITEVVGARTTAILAVTTADGRSRVTGSLIFKQENMG